MLQHNLKLTIENPDQHGIIREEKTSLVIKIIAITYMYFVPIILSVGFVLAIKTIILL